VSALPTGTRLWYTTIRALYFCASLAGCSMSLMLCFVMVVTMQSRIPFCDSCCIACVAFLYAPCPLMWSFDCWLPSMLTAVCTSCFTSWSSFFWLKANPLVIRLTSKPMFLACFITSNMSSLTRGSPPLIPNHGEPNLYTSSTIFFAVCVVTSVSLAYSGV